MGGLPFELFGRERLDLGRSGGSDEDTAFEFIVDDDEGVSIDPGFLGESLDDHQVTPQLMIGLYIGSIIEIGAFFMTGGEVEW